MHLRNILLAVAAGSSPLFAQRPAARSDSIAVADSLARRAHDLKAVTIVAAPTDAGQPSGILHVSAQSLREVPSNSTWDLLRQTTGLEIHQQGQGPGFASDASMRGFSSDHSTDLALWIDGVPVNEPVNGHAEGYNDWSLLFRGAVRDIDVIKGPTSPLFGNFALSGVVNVRTLERFRGSEVSVDGGSFGVGGATLLTGFDHGERGGGVFGLHAEREDGFRPNGGFDVMQGHARVVHELGPGVSIDVGTELYGADWKSSGFLSEDEFAARDYGIVSNPSDGGMKRHAQERVSVRVISGSLIWRSTVYATQGNWQLFLTIPPAGGKFEGTGSQTEEEDRRYGFGATTAATWLLPNAELTVGAESRWDHARYENYFTTAHVRDSTQALVAATQGSGALFVQSHVDLTDRLRVDLGARADAFDTRSMPDSASAVSASAAVFSPKLGMLYRYTPAVAGYVNVSRGFRSTDGVIGDPTLPLITAWAYEGGVRYDRDGVALSAALFRMDVSNELTFDPIARGSSSGGASTRQGLELGWSVPVARGVRTSGEWTFNDARYKHQTITDDAGAPVVLDGLRVYSTAQYVGAASVDLAPGAGTWRVRVGGNWVGPYSPFDEPGVVLGGYGLMHATVSTRWLGSDIDVGVRNVLDRAYPELVAGHLVAPGQPRAFTVGVRRGF
ncbi:MAG: TonB-dependent receptor [Gemmatimonadetes bacterium]|nr:TonB-dependent receptor [Gemmatimonadota bacterium]